MCCVSLLGHRTGLLTSCSLHKADYQLELQFTEDAASWSPCLKAHSVGLRLLLCSLRDSLGNADSVRG